MHETEYAYAVARIRANETSLLTAGDLEQLISAADTAAALGILADKGWKIPEGSESFDVSEAELAKAWELIAESVPDASLLEALTVANDFFNLKAAVKCVFSDLDPSDYYVSPCITDTALITSAIKNADLALLPPHLAQCGEKAYEAVAKFESGQLAESIIDKAALEAKLEYAKRAESALLENIADLTVAAANIKTALRCRMMGKSEAFAVSSMADCSIDTAELMENAASPESMAEFIASGKYAGLAESLKAGFAAFEKECDNAVVAMLDSTKFKTFGPDPIIAYYYAKQTETKNVRIILSAKAGGVPAETITERVRAIYV